MPVSPLAIALLLLLIALNAAISRAVSRSVFYSTQQKVVQVGLVWLMPLAGPLFVGMVLWSNHDQAFLSRHPPDVDPGDVALSSDPIDVYDV